MKIYFACRFDGPGWWYCVGILENGFKFASHLCTHPNFAPGDLYFNRPERIEALKELFGIDQSTVPRLTFKICSNTERSNFDKLIDGTKRPKSELAPFYEKYFNLTQKKPANPPPNKGIFTEG